MFLGLPMTYHNLPAARSLPLAALLLVAGCGGGGKTTDGVKGDTSSSVRVSASPTAIAYGGSTNITWSTKNPRNFTASNFGLDENSYTSGSLTDTPGTTTVYRLGIQSQDFNNLVGSVKVAVAPIAANVLVVGDASKAGPTQIQAFVRTIDTGTVTVAAAVPEPSDAYGVLVVSPTMVPTPGAAAQVKKWLDAGKGVVLCGRAPSILASGDSNNEDVSAIGAWFFGVDELGSGIGLSTYIRSSGNGLVKIATTLRDKVVDEDDSVGAIRDYGPQVDAIARGELCAYTVPTGGKLVYSGSPVGYGNAPDGTFQQAFESAFRWVGQ